MRIRSDANKNSLGGSAVYFEVESQAAEVRASRGADIIAVFLHVSSGPVERGNRNVAESKLERSFGRQRARIVPRLLVLSRVAVGSLHPLSSHLLFLHGSVEVLPILEHHRLPISDHAQVSISHRLVRL